MGIWQTGSLLSLKQIPLMTTTPLLGCLPYGSARSFTALFVIRIQHQTPRRDNEQATNTLSVHCAGFRFYF